MIVYGALAALAAGISLLCTFVMRSFARSVAIVDVPDERKIHAEAVPRFGGTAVYLAFALAMALAFDAQRFLGLDFAFSVAEYAKLMIGGTAVLLLGIYDDIRGARPSAKLAVEVGIAGLMFVLGYRIEAISNPFGGTVALGVLSVPVTILWIIVIMNALNLIDGVDGLAAGVTIIAAASSFVISSLLGNAEVAVAYAILFGAALGFLRYNFNPATIFLGDSGSLFLGFLLAVLSIKGAQKGPTSVAITVPILILGIPILDTAVAFVRRAIGKGAASLDGGSPWARLRKTMEPDRNHIHHRLLGFGLTHRQVSLLLYGVSALLSVVGMLTLFANRRGVAGFLVFAAAFAVAAVMHLGWFAFRKAGLSLAGRRGTRALLVGDPSSSGEEDPGAAIADLGYSVVRAPADEGALARFRGARFDVVLVQRDAPGFSPDLFMRVRDEFRFAVPILLSAAPADGAVAAREAARLGAYDHAAFGGGADLFSAVILRSFEKASLLARLRFVYGVAWLCVIFMPLLVALTFCACRGGVL